MQVSTGYIQRIKELRRDGYSYQKIADQTGVSIKTAHKWGKGEEVRGQVKPPRTQSFTHNLTSDKSLPLTPGKVGVRVTGKGKDKTLPTWAGVILVIMIIFFAFIALWLRQSEQTDTKRTDEQPKNKENLFDPNRTLQNLQEKEEFGTEDYHGCC